ncbi:hypothetical protein CH063_11171 [Colletotrichum higginsianum]|uniref:Uncharacterized protein n=1 Tax=Colletotrichum higginsianum (strain IMI 349063) TaxID=759273 RepID=H1VKA5_COLHI|nr:hypothetical protein CH63R_11820 [Colletotrichum higginsianum IMI 349063]OBR05117.1 hypothetical protein CH63R_11820 [Colletotrichum higginsianum IMI 349063]CCF40658.1 hypothetical protein CH063_11171 [Colletotrichum higginsianum]
MSPSHSEPPPAVSTLLSSTGAPSMRFRVPGFKIGIRGSMMPYSAAPQHQHPSSFLSAHPIFLRTGPLFQDALYLYCTPSTGVAGNPSQRSHLTQTAFLGRMLSSRYYDHQDEVFGKATGTSD